MSLYDVRRYLDLLTTSNHLPGFPYKRCSKILRLNYLIRTYLAMFKDFLDLSLLQNFPSDVQRTVDSARLQDLPDDVR